MSQLLDRAVDAILRIDLNHQIKFISNNGSLWLNGSAELATKNFLNIVHEDDIEIFSDLLASKKEYFSCEIRLKKDDKDTWAFLKCFYMTAVKQYTVCVIDISKWRCDSECMRKMTEYDALTKIANRVLLERTVNEYITLELENFSVALIDLDGFKKVNDTYGHLAGDAILVETAERLKKAVGNNNIPVRLGGDEFVILFGLCPEQEKINILKRVLQFIARPYDFDGRELFVGASIGIAHFPKHGTTYTSVLKNADIAMYRSKTNGKNQITVFTEATKEDDITINTALRRAISEGEFYLVYQPQYSIEKKLIGVEALMRWNSAIFGNVTPDRFIPIAEESGLMNFLGKWVLRCACWQLKQFQLKHPNLTMSVNVSASQFKHENFCDTVLEVINETGVKPNTLILEITESTLMVDYEKIIEVLNKLKAHHIQMSIDDFGTGFSSLAYLKYLPASHIKIDKTFVKTLSDERDKSLVLAMINLAHGLNLSCTAEGVETAEQFEFLKSNHCDYIQGYLLGKPMSDEHIIELLEKDVNRLP